MTEEQLRKAWAESVGKDPDSISRREKREPESLFAPSPEPTERERARRAAVEFQMREVISGIDAAWSRRERPVHAAAAARLPSTKRVKGPPSGDKLARAIAEFRRHPDGSVADLMQAADVSNTTARKARRIVRDQARASQGFTTARDSGNVSTNRERV